MPIFECKRSRVCARFRPTSTRRLTLLRQLLSALVGIVRNLIYMPSTEVQQFIDALQNLESSRQHDAMISLFAEDCTVGNVLAPDHFEGREGATKFWQDYRGSFGEIRSEFHHRVESANGAALEWVAQGTTTGNQPILYQGVTVLSFEAGKIKRFMAYFDPRGLGRQMEVPNDQTLQEV